MFVTGVGAYPYVTDVNSTNSTNITNATNTSTSTLNATDSSSFSYSTNITNATNTSTSFVVDPISTVIMAYSLGLSNYAKLVSAFDLVLHESGVPDAIPCPGRVPTFTMMANSLNSCAVTCISTRGFMVATTSSSTRPVRSRHHSQRRCRRPALARARRSILRRSRPQHLPPYTRSLSPLK